jgi:hypothetical protein
MNDTKELLRKDLWEFLWKDDLALSCWKNVYNKVLRKN